MTNDRELDSWREQWSSVAGPPAEFQRKVQERIKRQERRFTLGNLLAVIAFLGLLIFAVFMRHRSTWMGPDWSTGIVVLVFVAAGYRIWFSRGTWRPQTQSTRAFVEVWHKRVTARIRLLRISVYLSLGWIIFCAGLTAANWATIGRDVGAHPKALGGVAGCLRTHAIPGDLVRGGLAPAPQTGGTERSKKNHGRNGRKKRAVKLNRLRLSDSSILIGKDRAGGPDDRLHFAPEGAPFKLRLGGDFNCALGSPSFSHRDVVPCGALNRNVGFCGTTEVVPSPKP